jgi:methylmalonyl-CoA/ethylmalonyl-CoA epimerase
VVVRDIEAEVEGFARSIDAIWDTRIFHDPLQKVRVTFLRSSSPAEPQIELVEPAAEDSPVWRFLSAGGGLHHLCYEVNDLDSYLCELRKLGNIMVRPPLPAVAFEERRIAWVVTRPKLLLEFLERATA